jgi:hypothetical protein
MHQLILTVIALSLIAGMSIVTVNYLPAWANGAKDAHILVRDGARTLIKAFELRAQAHDGVAPMPEDAYPDFGLAAFYSNYYPFLPRAPQGYSWFYGFTPAVTLSSYGYPGAISNNNTDDSSDDGLFWFCLAPVNGGASEGVYRGIRRAQQVFPETQMYVNSALGAQCGEPVNSAEPSSFPANTVVTFFVRYIPDNPVE